MSLDMSFGIIKNALQREREAGPVNSLDAMIDSQRRRETIDRYWQRIQTELASVHQQIKDLPYLCRHKIKLHGRKRSLLCAISRFWNWTPPD